MNKIFEQYAALVSEWGKKMNLVSAPEQSAIMTQHIEDCVRAWECLERNLDAEKLVNLPIVDIGSGAGFPGVVWAILNPNTKVYLIEPREKRVTFLRHVVLKLSLKNVEVICSRFEDLPREQLPQRCLLTSRAVGYDADLTDRMLKEVVKSGSIWAVMCGPESSERLKNGVKRIVADDTGLPSVVCNSYPYVLDKELGERSIFVSRCD